MSSFASELDECLTRDLKHLYEVEAVPLYSSTKQENVQQPQSSSPGLLFVGICTGMFLGGLSGLRIQ